MSVLLNAPICHFFSSLSQWVHACDALQLPAQQREQLDSFIDQLYKDIEKGRVLSLLCSYIAVNNCCLHWIDLFWTHISLSVSHCLNSCVRLCPDQGGRSFFFLSSLCRNGRLSKLWGLWTFSSSKLMWVPSMFRRDLNSSESVSIDASLVSVGNHSCIPNAEVSFPNNNFLLQLSTLSDISPGEVSWHAWVWAD